MHSLTKISSKIGRLHTAYVTIVNLKDMIPTYLPIPNKYIFLHNKKYSEINLWFSLTTLLRT